MLPYYLSDAFDWRSLDLVGQEVVLALEAADAKVALKDVRSRIAKAQQLIDQPVVYVTDALASYERRHLIEHKVPFIVPGNQLYVPNLGLDLREYFRQRLAAPASFAPAAQATLITMLLEPGRPAWQARELAHLLGYTPMTLSRAIRELEQGGFVETRGEERSRRITLAGGPADIWERASLMLRSPVKKVAWSLPSMGHNAPLAGMSALAHYTMLSEPPSAVHAMGLGDWRHTSIEVLPVEQPSALMWEVWSYKPPTFRGTGWVDPLSLSLSLREDRDERVQIALDELKEAFPW